SQSDLIISHRLTARPDLEALRNIMQTYMTFDIKDYINDLPRKKGAAIVLDDNSERIYSMRVRPRMSWHAGSTPIALEEKEEF
ncbi:MAG: ATP-binding protein, partial [Candidatus Aenigmatarchaeota archaeon]